MKRFAKIILGVLATLVIVFLVVLVGVNLYLQSGDVQQRIRLATQKALGMPVTVRRTLYFPWSGLTLSGLSLPDPTVAGSNLMEAPRFSVQFQFWPLITSRKLVISQVRLSEPHLALRQTPDKQWVVVAPPPLRQPEDHPGPKPPSAGGVERPPEPRPAPYTVELKYFSIRGGSADIYDRKGVRLGRVTGLDLDGTFVTPTRIEGHLTVEDLEIVGLFYPNRLRADFVQEDDLLSVTNLKCAIADGKVRAEFSVLAPRKGDTAFQVRSQAEDISLPALISEAHLDSTGASGRLRGNLELRGDPLDVATLVGEGAFALDAAQLQPFDVIQQLGRILGIDELQLLKLNEAAISYDIHDEKVWITDARLRTENLLITGKGPIRFNGKMDIDGLFLVNEKLGQRFGGFLDSKLVPSTVPGYKEVAFKVTGRTSRPETDLPEKLTGIRMNSFGNIGNLGRLLQGFLVGPRPRTEVTPSPSPEEAAQN